MRFAFSLASLVLASSLLATASFAGPANKVTGDFIRVLDGSDPSRFRDCEISAHQEKVTGAKVRSQKGVIYCENEWNGKYWELDLNPLQTCVNVLDQYQARIAGQLVSGTAANNVYYGFLLLDNGEPSASAAEPDRFWVYNYGSDRDAGMSFCENGPGDADPTKEHTVTSGNRKIHFHE